jgi:NTE family protein
MIIGAVDAHTGELAAFDRDSGVDLVDAVAASTAAPGLVPTVSIHGARYIDGGVRSLDSADLASGLCERCGALSVGRTEPGTIGSRPVRGPAQTTGVGHGLASQVVALRKRGSRVEVITLDADSRAAMGKNQMHPATRIPAARAGFAQGKLEATRVTFL